MLLTGAFGTVYKGTVTVHQSEDTTEMIDVAVKTINAGMYSITNASVHNMNSCSNKTCMYNQCNLLNELQMLWILMKWKVF